MRDACIVNEGALDLLDCTAVPRRASAHSMSGRFSTEMTFSQAYDIIPKNEGGLWQWHLIFSSPVAFTENIYFKFKEILKNRNTANLSVLCRRVVPWTAPR